MEHHDESAVRIIDQAARIERPERHLPLGLIVGAAVALFVVQLVVFAETGDAAATEIVEDFVTTFNAGDGEAISDMLSDEPSILAWPAGPPWGGGLQLFVELVPPGEEASLDHASAVSDYVDFHAEMAGDMRVEFCFEVSERITLDERIWVSCRFSLVNDLALAIDPDSPEAAGVIRFGLEEGAIDAIVIEDVADPAPSGIPFLLWVKAEHSDVFAELLNGRITVPDYRPSTGQRLLALAQEYGS